MRAGRVALGEQRGVSMPWPAEHGEAVACLHTAGQRKDHLISNRRAAYLAFSCS